VEAGGIAAGDGRGAMIDLLALSKLQGELGRGERLVWAGMPNPAVIFHSDDWLLIPFGLMFGGFSIFWEAMVLRMPNSSFTGAFFVLWGVPFVVIGQYLIWGRFLYDGWLKRRTYYGVTNLRVLIVQQGWKRKVSSTYLESLPQVEKEGQGTGTLWFGPRLPAFAGRGQPTRGLSRFSVGSVPSFADIDDVDGVDETIADLKRKARQAQD
jgi:hypothetical protein